ncbi:hypothetical protein [Streptomyces hydrogenans]|uniref:hypothetical protein n=1 Tax=Streptomyces hydrogenans TaxID=1873719 RepID=UPI003D711793
MAKDDDSKTPQEWRELLRTTYDYPEEVNEGRRAKRRRARRAYRQSERRRTAEWISRERRREPITAAGALLVVVVILAMGALARFGPDWIRGERDGGAGKVTATQPAASPSDDGKPGAGSGADSPPPASPSPSVAVDLSNSEKVAEQFVRHYLTRNPPEDQDHTAAVLRAQPWATPGLVENLANHSDPAFAKLVSHGGVSTVSTVKVEPADQGLPVDTPVRVWRKVTAKVDVQGYTDYSETTTLQTELTSTGAGWRVSRILGV